MKSNVFIYIEQSLRIIRMSKKNLYYIFLSVLLIFSCNEDSKSSSSPTEKSANNKFDYNLWYASITEKGKANGSSWDNAWSYTSFPQEKLKGGDTLFLDGGISGITYKDVWLIENLNGGYEKPIVIINGRDINHNGQVVFYRDTTNLDTNWKTGNNLYVGENSRNIKFKNLKFTYAYRNISVDKAKKIYFDSCTVVVNYEAGFSIGDSNPGTDSLEVENCAVLVDRPMVNGVWYQGDGWRQNIADNVIIRNNYFAITDGGDKTHSDVIQIYGNTSNNLEICNNILKNNKTYSYLGNNQIIYITAIGGIVKIYNNVIISSSNYSQSPMLDISPSNGLDSLSIYNNSFYGKHQQRGIVVSDLDLSPNGITQIKNNAIYSTGNAAIAIGEVPAGTLIIDNNISFAPDNPKQTYEYNGSYKSFAQWQALGFDINGSNEDLKYISLTYDNENLQLANGSPCLNAGAVVSWIKKDINGTMRSQNSGYDIGAFNER